MTLAYFRIEKVIFPCKTTALPDRPPSAAVRILARAAAAQRLRPHLGAATAMVRLTCAPLRQVTPGEILAAERCCADALAGRLVDGVGDGRRCRRAGGLAETAPFRTAGRREVGFDMRVLVDAEQV